MNESKEYLKPLRKHELLLYEARWAQKEEGWWEIAYKEDFVNAASDDPDGSMTTVVVGDNLDEWVCRRTPRVKDVNLWQGKKVLLKNIHTESWIEVSLNVKPVQSETWEMF